MWSLIANSKCKAKWKQDAPLELVWLLLLMGELIIDLSVIIGIDWLIDWELLANVILEPLHSSIEHRYATEEFARRSFSITDAGDVVYVTLFDPFIESQPRITIGFSFNVPVYVEHKELVDSVVMTLSIVTSYSKPWKLLNFEKKFWQRKAWLECSYYKQSSIFSILTKT